MKRQEKYPDTDVFHYYNANPKNRITGDCVVMAVSTVCDIPYNDVIIEFANITCETGHDCYGFKGFDIFMKRHGWIKMKQPRKIDNTKYTGKEFCQAIQDGAFNNKHNRIAANIGGNHMVAIVDGVINDIWDSSNKCIGNYWIKG